MTAKIINLPRPFSSTLPGVYPRNMPPELLAQPRWLALRSKTRKRKFEPIDWNDHVMENDVELTGAEHANAIAERHRCQIAYYHFPSMLQRELISIRLYHAFDPDNGRILPWARPIVARLLTETYWQRFDRGTGIEFLLRGLIELEFERFVYESSRSRIEILQGERFIPMTGDNDFTVPIRNCQVQLDWLKRYLTESPCLLCGRPWCLGHEPWDRVGSETITHAEKTHTTMKHVARKLDELRRKPGYSLFPNAIWQQAIAKTVESGLTVDQRMLLLVSWAQRHSIPNPETPIRELIETFDGKNARSHMQERFYEK